MTLKYNDNSNNNNNGSSSISSSSSSNITTDIITGDKQAMNDVARAAADDDEEDDEIPLELRLKIAELEKKTGKKYKVRRELPDVATLLKYGTPESRNKPPPTVFILTFVIFINIPSSRKSPRQQQQLLQQQQADSWMDKPLKTRMEARRNQLKQLLHEHDVKEKQKQQQNQQQQEPQLTVTNEDYNNEIDPIRTLDL
jgi:hypothetical protein